MKRALTIAASDSSASTGVQSDLRVFSRCGVYGTCAVTLIAAQDTFAVRRVLKPAPIIVGAQVDAVVKDIGVDACKIGWCRSAELIPMIAGRVRRHGLKPVVLDPCLWSDRGAVLTPPRTVKRMVRELLPRITILTVTLRELGVLAGMPADTPEMLQAAVARIRAIGPEGVVVEDAPAAEGPAILVCDAAGEETVADAPGVAQRLGDAGSIFSAALTAALARGDGLREAARFADVFVARAASESAPVGKGQPVLV